MHVQSCCFSSETYCFYDVFFAVRVVGSLSPYYKNQPMFLDERTATEHGQQDFLIKPLVV